MTVPDGPESTDVDPLQDPHRIAAARRLFVEVGGPAAYDRLSSLAARLLRVGHAKVTLFTDGDTVVGGFGLPAGGIRGPAPPPRAPSPPRRAPPTAPPVPGPA